MKNFNILGVHWKICLLGGGVMKNQYRGGLPKKGGGGLQQFGDLRGRLDKKEGRGCFWGRGVDNPMHTIVLYVR